jgi:hypothetical protein
MMISEIEIGGGLANQRIMKYIAPQQPDNSVYGSITNLESRRWRYGTKANGPPGSPPGGPSRHDY